MKSNTDRSYHHGDLRHALVEAALAYIEEGNANFTLRSVARRAGVSHAAPYNHFQDKQELLAEVAAVGFDSLREALEHASTDIPNPKDLFLMRWQAFLNFGVSYPEHYRLMAGPIIASNEYPRLTEASQAAYHVLTKDLEYYAAEGFFSPELIDSYAVIAWSHLHGLTMLAIDGRLTWYSKDLAKLAENAIDVLLRGMKITT